MNSNIINLLAQITVGMIVYTMVLMAARRRAGAAGFKSVQAILSLCWWVSVDVLLMCTSFFLARAAYYIWMPAESSLEELSPLLAGWFRGSHLEIADIFALAVTLLVFGVAHAFAFSTIWVRSNVTGQDKPTRPELVTYVAGMVVLGGALFFLIRQWEAPVIALRIAQLLGSAKFDTQIEDILAVGDVWGEIITKSWLLASISGTWAIGIIFTAWGTVSSHIAFENALNPAATTPKPKGKASSEELKEDSLEGTTIPSVVENHQTNTDTPQTTAAEKVAEHARIRAAEAEARAARQAEVFATVPPAAPVSSPPGGTAFAQAEAQTLVNQTADLYDHVANLERANTALRAQSAKNPLDLPNITPAAPAFSESTAHEPAATPRDEMEDGAPATPFSRNGTR